MPSLQSQKSRDEVFEYLSECANAAEWDPGLVFALEVPIRVAFEAKPTFASAAC
jgi:hypothetical protein